MASSSRWMREVSTPASRRLFHERGREDVAADPPHHGGWGAVPAGGDCLVAALAAADERDRLAHEGLVQGGQTRRGDDDVQMQGAADDDSAVHPPVP